MFLYEIDNNFGYAKLSSDEEYALAKWVMDVLCLRWVDSKDQFHKLLQRIYWKKCQGYDLSFADFIGLWQCYERYRDALPEFPKLKDDKKYIYSPKELQGRKLDDDEREVYVRREISRAWYETWQNHPKIQKRVEGCATFEGFVAEDVPEAHVERQKRLEMEFWERADYIQRECDVSREQAMAEAQDIVPRADPEYQMPDPKYS